MPFRRVQRLQVPRPVGVER